jgi:hypothetical protein
MKKNQLPYPLALLYFAYMEASLKLISGICWSTVYIVLIYNGFKHTATACLFLHSD